MGISIDAAKFLAKARKDGVRFDETLKLWGVSHMLIKTDRLADTLEALRPLAAAPGRGGLLPIGRGGISHGCQLVRPGPGREESLRVRCLA